MLAVFLMLASLAGASSSASPDPGAECRSAFGMTACGYHCVAAFGDVKCAATSSGACKAAFGEVVCTDGARPRDPGPPCCKHDPPRDDRGSWPNAECRSGFGKTACGYHCVAAYGDVKCAATPAGACQAGFGVVACGDPAHYRAGMPNVRCLAGFGKVACGYGCVAGFGDVKCARRPSGTCKAAYGEVVCSD